MRVFAFGWTWAAATVLALVALPANAGGGPPAKPPAGPASTALGWVSGTVTDGDDKPLAGAEVKVLREQPPGAWTGTSDAKGYYAVKGVPAGPALVIVSSRGRVPVRQEVKVPSAGSVAADAKLEMGVRFAGKITDTDGKPVGHASILAFDSSNEGGPRSFRFVFALPTGSGTSEADGTFVVDGLAPGSTYRLRVTHPHYVPVDLPGLPAEAGGGHDSLEVTVEPAAWLSGTVVDPSGNPVAGAYVHGPMEDGEGVWLGSFFVKITRSGRDAAAKDGNVTDARGHFELGSLKPGEVKVTAAADAYFEGSVTVDSLETGKETTGVKVVLEPATAWVEGTVVDSDGKGIAGVDLVAWGDVGRAASGKTDGGGHFRLERVRSHGPVQVTARQEGYGAKTKDGVELGSKACKLEMVRSARLKIKVLDPAGKAVSRVTVRVLVSAEDSDSSGSTTQVAQTEAGLDIALPVGEVEVRVGAIGYDEVTAGSWTTESGKTIEGGTVSLSKRE